MRNFMETPTYFFMVMVWCISLSSVYNIVRGQKYGQRKDGGHRGRSFPDIRGQSWDCGEHIPKIWRKNSFVCDPDSLLNESEDVYYDRTGNCEISNKSRNTKSIQAELMGEPESKIDAGTVSLIISVGVAVILVLIITGCVCAFRCCGNLRADPETPLRRTLERVDSLKAEVIRRGSLLRRSFSRSPKFPRRSSPIQQVEEITTSPQTLGYIPYEGTSMV